MDTTVQNNTEIRHRIREKFDFLYGEQHGEQCVARLQQLLSEYGHSLKQNQDKRHGWDESDAILITYGDVIQCKGEACLPRLKAFLDDYLADVISTVHVLPFFPSSSDGGFSVIDYKEVREDLGSWDDIKALTENYRLMADLVINHTSRFSDWFENYKKGESPGKDYFIEVESDSNFPEVVRPRDTPLITAVQTDNGLRHVWTTFSDDQVDLDFSNPDVLFEFIDIFLFYYQQGIDVIRLDAIAYLWKQEGTPSIHLEQTHKVVKLFRDLAECIDPDITLITETNVPFKDNISYFGDEDEAHMIYQFSLPPLLLHAILTENAQYLTKWAAELPELPDDCTYFNFTASHDGIGVRPLEGLVPDEEFDYLIESTEERGGFVSYKENTAAGANSKSPYELNITYFDAFEDPGNPRTEKQKRRYMCSQIIMLSLAGVPGIYFHNFTATKNNLEGVLESGVKRDINRKKFVWDELIDLVENPDRINHHIFESYKRILSERKQHPAFHPAGDQRVVEIGDNLFSLLRTSPDREEQILVIANVTSDDVEVQASELEVSNISDEGLKDLIGGKMVFDNGSLKLNAFQVVWLAVE